ncbi:glycosyltransferase [Pullulanibacillus sp. KACC 23026]|uniref:teichuronic acid biosynthesis protein TuaH n=1 Tax=Pullulanibacillus sp. KACC 23026 TaxID=3028315 RepID=UPI0023AEB546|nr:glycosyltransferase [Pullulanibacillus sp. KACC 23026]WEG12628.1 glycosyltransferase [Pullulanibacillus sp. KACC 23026]
MKTIHVIVATGEWEQDRLRYRRHRLAEYLQGHDHTEEVIWLCPAPPKQETQSSVLTNGVKQWTVMDIHSHKLFRFGRYISLFYKRKLGPLVDYLQKAEGKYQLILWYTFPGFPKVLEMVKWDQVVYDCSDLWAAPISGRQTPLSKIRQEVIAKAETFIIQEATTIFCTSDYLRERVVSQLGSGEKVVTFENGVEFALFASEISQKESVLPADFSGTVLGYIGGIKPKLDFKLIFEAAKQKKDDLFMFVGPDQTNDNSGFKQLLSLPNVIWTGSVPPMDVPMYMNLIDIGIMPYKDSPYNKAVFPLKLFEFMAAGKPVVGLHLPSTTKFVEEGVYLQEEGIEGFLKAIEQLNQVKGEEKCLEVRKQRAKAKDWEDVFKGMLLVLNKKRQIGQE